MKPGHARNVKRTRGWTTTNIGLSVDALASAGVA